MFSLLFFVLFGFVLSNEFPPIKYPKNGIFGWFNSLSHMMKPFNNKKILGFRANTTQPDLNMIAIDIAGHLNLHDLNISGRINDAINHKKKKTKKQNAISLASNEKCPYKNQYENVYQFCHLTGINLDLENIGIPPDHVNILIGNVAGFFPTGLFLLILACVTIIFYILQLFLCCFTFKPSEHSSPYIWSAIIFYAGDILIIISAILYFCSFTGVNSIYSTLISLNTIVPRMTYSIASSLESLTSKGIPNSFGSLIQILVNICNSTKNYFDATADSFLRPTIILQQKMISNNESNLGVFTIYNEIIHPLANKFYQNAKKYPKLANISKYFAQQNFSSYQKQMDNFLDSELNFADKMKELNSFFEYLNSTLEPYQQFIIHLPNQTLKGKNKTIEESINILKEKSLESFDSLTTLNQKAKKKHKFYNFICAIFFIFGVVLLGAPIFLGIMYLKHTKCSICIASTVSIYPIIATILMFAVAAVFTGIGFADIVMSDQLEPSLDQFLTKIISITIPTFEIVFPPINFSNKTNNHYNGILNLSKIVFPDPIHSFEYLSKSDEKTGIAESLRLNKIINMNNYGDEIGDFIINLGQNFTLPKIIIQVLNVVGDTFRLISEFPDTIDGFFNWGIQMTETTNQLRQEINENDPKAMLELEPYLAQIDNYVLEMNSQYNIARYQISVELPNALDKIDEKLSQYIESVLKDLGSVLKHLFRNVYPVLNSIQVGPLIGPYAILRNFFFYDLASTSAYLSASGTLMMFGLIFVVILMWIRRRGMLSAEDAENARKKDSELNLKSLDENYHNGNNSTYNASKIAINPTKNARDVVYKSFV